MTKTQIYSDEKNEAHELATLATVASANPKWKFARSIEKKSSFDGFIYERKERIGEWYDAPIAMCEIRRLHCSHKDYETAMISYTKIQHWQTLFPTTHIKCYFVVNWKDRLAAVDMEDIAQYGDVRVSPFSKKRKNPENDREIVFHYPVNKFRTLIDSATAGKLYNVKSLEEAAAWVEATKGEKG
jgi:hypothetical protein